MNKTTLPLYALTVEEFESMIRRVVLETINDNLSKAKNTVDESLIKIEEVCQLLKVSKVTVFKWIKNKRIQSYRIGSRLFFKRQEIIECLTPSSKQ